MKKIKTLCILLVLLSMSLSGCGDYADDETPPETEFTGAPAVSVETEACVEDSGTTYYNPEFYKAVGTGAERPDDYKGVKKSNGYYYQYPRSWQDYREDYSCVKHLKNQEHKALIEEWIAEAEAELLAEMPALRSYCEARGYVPVEEVQIFVQAVNGYLSVKAHILAETMYGIRVYDYKCAVFDLYTGEKLELSDLFFSREDFLPELNGTIYQAFNTPDVASGFEFYIPGIKREFAGLTTNCMFFTSSGMCFPIKNPFIDGSMEVSFMDMDSCAVNYPRDMAGIFDDDSLVKLEDKSIYVDFKPAYAKGNVIMSRLLEYVADVPPEKLEQINNAALDLMYDKEVKEVLKERFGADLLPDDESYFDTHEYWEGLFLSAGVNRELRLVDVYITINEMEITSGVHRYLDLDTLKPLSPREIVERKFGKDWEENYEIQPLNKKYADLPVPGIDDFKWYDVYSYGLELSALPGTLENEQEYTYPTWWIQEKAKG